MWLEGVLYPEITTEKAHVYHAWRAAAAVRVWYWNRDDADMRVPMARTNLQTLLFREVVLDDSAWSESMAVRHNRLMHALNGNEEAAEDAGMLDDIEMVDDDVSEASGGDSEIGSIDSSLVGLREVRRRPIRVKYVRRARAAKFKALLAEARRDSDAKKKAEADVARAAAIEESRDRKTMSENIVECQKYGRQCNEFKRGAQSDLGACRWPMGHMWKREGEDMVLVHRKLRYPLMEKWLPRIMARMPNPMRYDALEEYRLTTTVPVFPRKVLDPSVHHLADVNWHSQEQRAIEGLLANQQQGVFPDLRNPCHTASDLYKNDPGLCFCVRTDLRRKRECGTRPSETVGVMIGLFLLMWMAVGLCCATAGLFYKVAIYLTPYLWYIVWGEGDLAQWLAAGSRFALIVPLLALAGLILRYQLKALWFLYRWALYHFLKVQFGMVTSCGMVSLTLLHDAVSQTAHHDSVQRAAWLRRTAYVNIPGHVHDLLPCTSALTQAIVEESGVMGNE